MIESKVTSINGVPYKIEYGRYFKECRKSGRCCHLFCPKCLAHINPGVDKDELGYIICKGCSQRYKPVRYGLVEIEYEELRNGGENMSDVDRILPWGPIDRLIRRAKVERVSMKAVKTLTRVLEDIGLEIADNAKMLALHSKRKTVNERDIKQAYESWLKDLKSNK